MKFRNPTALCALALFVTQSSLAQPSQQSDGSLTERLERLEVAAKRTDGIFTYAKAYGLLSKFSSLSSRSKIDLALYLRPTGDVRIKPAEVRLNVQGSSYVAKVPIRDDWRLTVPLSQIALDEGADFVMNQDLDRFQRVARVEILKPPQAVMPLSYYFEALDEVASAERKLLFFFAPPKTTIAFVFGDSIKPSVEISCEGRSMETLTPQTTFPSIVVSFDPSWRRRECQIAFSPAIPNYSVPVYGK